MALATAAIPLTEFRVWLARSRAWLSLLLLTPVVLWAVTSPPPFAPGTWGACVCHACGWLAFVSGAAFRWWATLYIGGQKNSRLATEGAYSVCRNPLYAGSFLLALSAAGFCQSWSFAVGLLVVSAFYLAITVSAEEAVLHARFGNQFVAYLAATPRCLPRWSAHRSSARIEVSLDGLRAELLRTARWIWIPVICELLQTARAAAWWPWG